MAYRPLPVPDHFDPARVGEIWKVPYQRRAREARAWAEGHGLEPAARDGFRLCLILVDVQNTFCLPDFELFAGGRSGTGAVDDSRRLCEFIYRNLGHITQIAPTLDTHQAMQVFHPVFLVDADGHHPEGHTLVTYQEIKDGRWRFNPRVAESLGFDPEYGQRHLEHYARELDQREKYDLMVWPYHAMLGSIGHALVPAVEEAVFFHTIARYAQADFEVKGQNVLTEHYSVVGPEVLTDAEGAPIADKSDKFLRKVEQFDAVVLAGQAKSHCVAWTLEDLLQQIQSRDPSLAKKVYLLEDCTSPVVVPGVVDFTEMADAAFDRFAEAGMHRVRSSDPLEKWPGM